jgi:8-oxo-dGTP pyrophosphatase MutT (NUDIX family)
MIHTKDFLHFPSGFYPQAKPAAVSFLIFKEKNTFYLGMILRNAYPGVHSAQVGFPGGKFDEGSDETLLDACFRECFEELGIKLKEENILGRNDDIYIPPSNFKVRSYITLLPNLPDLVIDEREVNQFLKVPLDIFYHSQNYRQTTISTHTGSSFKTLGVLFNGLTIWGASLKMIQLFVQKHPNFIKEGSLS